MISDMTMLIRTKSFEIAVYAKGDIDSDKLALVLPGKLDTKDYLHMHSHVDCLARNGFYALSFDPPGTWESPGDIELYTVSNYLQAVNEVIAHYGNKNTFVVGHSLGGSVALLAGTRNVHVTCFASIMGRPTLNKKYPDEEWEKSGRILSQRDVPNKIGELKEFRLPYAFLEDMAQYDMSEDLRTCTKSKLFIAGSEDNVVPKQIVEGGFDISSNPKMMKIIPANHDYRQNPDSIEQVNRLLEEFVRES